MIDVVEASIADLEPPSNRVARHRFQLVQAYLERIAAYDGPDGATALKALVVLNPDALAEAAEADAHRADRRPLGPPEASPTPSRRATS